VGKDTSIPKLEKDLGFGKGSIYKWDKNSPSIDKLQKVADHFEMSVDSLIASIDKLIINTIKLLAKNDKTHPYFSSDAALFLHLSLEVLKKEYQDVPLDTDYIDPMELIRLIREVPLSMEFKKDFLRTLNRVKGHLNIEDTVDALTLKEERDIAHDLEKMLSDLESDNPMAFHGEPMDDEDKELLRISLESSMRLAKQMAKRKFNPNKNKK